MKKRSLITAVLASCLFLTAAHAGFNQVHPVTVDLVAHSASGSLGSARNSADTVQYIGCQVAATPGAVSETAVCLARNAAGTFGSCTTTDPNLRRIVETVSSDSYVEFAWNTAGTCTWVKSQDVSTAEPKK